MVTRMRAVFRFVQILDKPGELWNLTSRFSKSRILWKMTLGMEKT